MKYLLLLASLFVISFFSFANDDLQKFVGNWKSIGCKGDQKKLANFLIRVINNGKDLEIFYVTGNKRSKNFTTLNENYIKFNHTMNLTMRTSTEAMFDKNKIIVAAIHSSLGIKDKGKFIGINFSEMSISDGVLKYKRFGTTYQIIDGKFVPIPIKIDCTYKKR